MYVGIGRWALQEAEDKWVDYSPSMMEKLEEAYLANEDSLEFQGEFNGLAYKVDLWRFVQITLASGKERQIVRKLYSCNLPTTSGKTEGVATTSSEILGFDKKTTNSVPAPNFANNRSNELETSISFRLQDVLQELGLFANPVSFNGVPLVSLQEAVNPLLSILPELSLYVYGCQSWVEATWDLPTDIPYGLTVSEAAAINLYTKQFPAREASIYFQLNSVLRTVDRRAIKPFLLYAKLLLSGLCKIPRYSSAVNTVWRGVSDDISLKYVVGKKYWWWGFSSCTSDMQSAASFLSDSPHKVLFNIHFRSHVVDISQFSDFAKEREVLLLPGRQFKVVNNATLVPGVCVIELLEDETAPNMLIGINLPS